MAVITGTSGADTLHGGAGNDSIVGYGSADEIVGWQGNDVLRGGAGNDTFIWGQFHGDDRVRRFTEGDELVFSAVSPKTISLVDTADGIRISYGSFYTPDEILLVGVHDMDLVISSITVTSDNVLA